MKGRSGSLTLPRAASKIDRVARRTIDLTAPNETEHPAAAVRPDDGLDVIRRLVVAAPPLLQAGGALALEVGAGQAATVARLFAADGRYAAATVAKDLAGIERVVAARLL